jgi:hypothetical protein
MTARLAISKANDVLAQAGKRNVNIVGTIIASPKVIFPPHLSANKIIGT